MRQAEDNLEALENWWRTEIIDVKPGSIDIRGYPIETLIGRIGYAQMVWLMLRGEIPSAEQGRLLEAALVAAVDHGPQAPSIAIARMSVTCGVGVNNAMASAVNVLGDIHGGAGQQCMALYETIIAVQDADQCSLRRAVDHVLDDYRRTVSPIIPGFGHRFHPVDPRATRLFALLTEACALGTISGRYLQVAHSVQAAVAQQVGKAIPINIDGATATVYCELGFASALGRGLFILSRSVGILAHAYEQSLCSERIKGPMPPNVSYRYTGQARRDFTEEE